MKVEGLLALALSVRLWNKGDFAIMRDIITLSCEQCKNKNYTTTKNKRKTPDKLALKKYCRFCGTHTIHKETK